MPKSGLLELPNYEIILQREASEKAVADDA